MFGIGNFAFADVTYPGVVVDGEVRELSLSLGRATTMDDLFANWAAALVAARELAGEAPGAGRRLEDVKVLPPVPSSCQLLCAGANYFRHTAEMTYIMARRNPDEARSEDELRSVSSLAGHRLRESGVPFMFAGATSALSGANDDIILWGPGRQHDWELELGVIIGKHGHDVSPDDALDLVAGYVVANDITTRDLIWRSDLPMADFFASKNRPTWFPTGPYLVPAEFIPDPRSVQLQLHVNGELMQDSDAGDMIFNVSELVSFASKTVSLRPGDLILTGSPAGNAAAHGDRWLTPGDVIESEISGIGAQRNRCVAPPKSVVGPDNRPALNTDGS